MSSTSDAATPAAKTVKPGKKEIRDVKDSKKAKEESGDAKSVALIRQMAADLAEVAGSLARLQTDVDALKKAPPASLTESGERRTATKGRSSASSAQGNQIVAALEGDETVLVALAVRGGDQEGEAPFVHLASAPALSAVDSARLAKIAYAFSSQPKVALMRILLDEGEQTAAQLGEKASLTTGSLYHHLRELVHAEVARQGNRNRYILTDLGRRTTLTLLALSSS